MRFLLLFVFLVVSGVGGLAQDTIHVYFPHNGDEAIDFKALDQFAESMNSKQKAEIIGYTDHLGSESYNQELSIRRVNAVAKHVIKTRADKIQIASRTGKGKIASPENTDRVPEHRRVDVIIRPVQEKKKKQIDFISVPSETIVDTLKLDTAGKDGVFELKGLSFYGGRHYPLPESVPELLKLAKTLRLHPELKIEILGYICCQYEYPDGMDMDTGEPLLSLNRARFVNDFLVSKGIDANRLSYKGMGSQNPKVYPELTPHDQQANRRVEIRIVP